MDPSERTMLVTSARAALGAARARTAVGADAALAGLGWLDMLRADPRDAVGVVFTAMGACDAPGTALDDVVTGALGIEPRADLAVLLPAFATSAPPAHRAGDTVQGRGLLGARAATATEVVVPTALDGTVGTVTVPIGTVKLEPVRGIDPDAGWHTAAVELTGTAAPRAGADRWGGAVAAARRALGHQIAGACRTIVELAGAHAVERVQFGRPVARFQAVRHRLADALVAVEALEAALGAAWDEPGPATAALAKAIAGRTAETVATHGQQVLAGVGFTTEHPFHRYRKRTMALAGLFGTSDDIVVDLGRELLGTRTVPTVIEL
jgi:hypothetical protein